MTVIAPSSSLQFAPRPQACLAPARTAADESGAKPKAEAGVDKLLRLTNYGVGGAGSIAGLVAIPSQVAKYGPSISRTAASVGLYATVAAGKNSGLAAATAGIIAKSATLVVNTTPTLSKLAHASMKVPVVGRVFSPGVAKVMTDKVLPAANAVGAGIAILDNGNRYYKASKANNNTGKVIAGAQIAINGSSAVLGFLPGKAQWVSAGLGLVGLGLELTHQIGGVGK